MSVRPTSGLDGPPQADRLKAVLAAGLAQRQSAVVSGFALQSSDPNVSPDKKAQDAGFTDSNHASKYLSKYKELVFAPLDNLTPATAHDRIQYLYLRPKFVEVLQRLEQAHKLRKRLDVIAVQLLPKDRDPFRSLAANTAKNKKKQQEYKALESERIKLLNQLKQVQDLQRLWLDQPVKELYQEIQEKSKPEIFEEFVLAMKWSVDLRILERTE